MSRIVTVIHDYATTPEAVWALATDCSALAEVMAGLVHFTGMPKGRIYSGQRIEVMASLFGRLPAQPYRMTVLLCDDTARIFESDEDGMGVKRWSHRLTVTEIPGGARLTDRIDIDAGWKTPIYAAWARIMYRARHKPRLRLLGLA